MYLHSSIGGGADDVVAIRSECGFINKRGMASELLQTLA